MEYMDGGTLAHLLQRLRIIEEPYLAVLARQVQWWHGTLTASINIQQEPALSFKVLSVQVRVVCKRKTGDITPEPLLLPRRRCWG